MAVCIINTRSSIPGERYLDPLPWPWKHGEEMGGDDDRGLVRGCSGRADGTLYRVYREAGRDR